MSAVPGVAWTAVVPIRSWTHGKTRLAAPGVPREDLARAFGLDVIEAAATCPVVERVVVVTSDAAVIGDVAAFDVLVEADPGRGLVPAVAAGVDRATTEGAVRRVVVPADLPTLTAPALAAALDLAGVAPLSCVDDADGDGTTLLLHQGDSPFRSAYGPGSAAAHRVLGAVPLVDAPEAVRRDVDTPAHLADAVRVGVGPRTAAVLRRR